MYAQVLGLVEIIHFLMCFRCQSIREEKQKKEEAEIAREKAKEEERRKREEEEEARRRMEEEEERRKAEEEEIRIRAEEEAIRKAQKEAEQKRREEEEERLAREPQTKEFPDIELVTEEMLDRSLPVQDTEKERGEDDGEVTTGSHTEDEQDKDEDDDDEWLFKQEDGEPLPLWSDLETNGTLAKAGPQLDEKEEEEELENQTQAPGSTSDALTPTSPGQYLDKQASNTTSAQSNNEPNRVRPLAKGQASRSQEKREQRRRRGLEHNQRETERAASTSSSSSATGTDQTSPPKRKGQETSKLKERADSKELDQYTFVAWKVKDDKVKAKASSPSAGLVRPTTLSLQPADALPERNNQGEVVGAVNLQRRSGAIKEKPEKWRGIKSDEDHSERPLNREERRKKQPLYVSCSHHNHTVSYKHI